MMRRRDYEDLLQATLKILCDNSKTPDDVLWVGTIAGFLDKSHRFTWEEFASKANFVYHFGYGQIEILHNLIIVGKDFWLDRCDWDGSEWWEFNQIPSNPELTLIEREGGYEKIVDGVLY